MRIALVTGVLLSLFCGGAEAAQSHSAATAPGATVDDGQRAANRAQRASTAKEYLDAKKSAENTCLTSLAGIARWLVTLNAKADAKQIVSEIRDADPKFTGLAQLEKLVDDIAQPTVLDEKKKHELATRKTSAQHQKAAALLELAGRCYRAELMGYAYDVAWAALDADPDNTIARSAMGQTKVGDKWYTPYEAAALGEGNVYVAEAGWVPKDSQKRVAAGEWYENGKWMTLADANKLHANSATPWTIETDNFILKSTATRKQAIFIAEKLEAIRELCFREYLEFFLRGSKKAGGQMLFNKPFAKKLIVNYAGNKSGFEQEISASAIPAEHKGLLLRSAGFYSGHVHASFFYYDPNFGPFQVSVMQHEVTHQILGEYSNGSALFPWLSEGVAEVLEAAAPNSAGRILLPHGYEHPDVIAAAEMARRNTLPDLTKLTALTREGFHNEAVRSINYQVSGAFCRFLLEYKNGAYAADFLEFLYDSYQQRASNNLQKYMDLDIAALDKEFRVYLAGCDSSYSRREVADRPVKKAAAGGSTPSRDAAKKSEPLKSKDAENGGGLNTDDPFKRNEN